MSHITEWLCIRRRRTALPVSCPVSVWCPDSVRIFKKTLSVVCLSVRTGTRQSCPDFHSPCPPTSAGHENIFWSSLLRLALMDFDQTELELYISSKTTYLWPYKLWKRWIDNIDNKDMVSLYSRVLRKWKVIIVYILKMPGIFFFRVNLAH